MNVFGNNKIFATVCAFVMLFALFQFASAANATVSSSNNSTLKITSFTSSAYVISGDQNVSFFNATSGGVGTIMYYYTLCGCGHLIDNGNNHFSFSNPGYYTLELAVQDQSGQTNQSFLNITVDPVLKITSFTANTYLISGDQRISLYNQTSGGTGGISYYYILCGCANGSLVNYGNNEFGFSQPGSYVVALNVTDQSGETNQSTINVQVNNTLETELFANVSTVTQGQSISFSNTTSGGTGGNTYTLSVNNTNGTTIAGNGVTFTSPGSYAVTLNVADQSGETANSTVVVTVLKKTVVNEQSFGGGGSGSSTTAGVVLTNNVNTPPSNVSTSSTANDTNTSISLDISVDSNVSTIKSVTPSSFEDLVKLSGASGVKPLPNGYVGLFIGNISVNSTAVKTINLTIQYQCNLNNNGTIEPYMLEAGVWTPISQFVLNSTACSVSLITPADPVVALVQQEQVPTPLAAPATSSGQQEIIIHPFEPTSHSNNNYLVLIIAGVAMVACVLMIVVRPNKSKVGPAKSKNGNMKISKK